MDEEVGFRVHLPCRPPGCSQSEWSFKQREGRSRRAFHGLGVGALHSLYEPPETIALLRPLSLRFTTLVQLDGRVRAGRILSHSSCPLLQSLPTLTSPLPGAQKGGDGHIILR